MMDCLEAQQLVSAALDHEAGDPDRLAAAKEHCRTCDECGEFVKALIAIGRAPLPEPPDDIFDRIMGTVNAERARAERASAAIASTQRASETATGIVGTIRDEAQPDALSLKERLLHPRNRRAIVAWSSAAAVALVAAGVGVVYGTRAILTDSNKMQTIVLESGDSVAQESVTGTFGNAVTPQDSPAQRGATAETMSADAASGTGLIVVDGAVYQAAGADPTVTKSTLMPRGSTRSALRPGGIASEREVLGTSDPSRVFIESDDDEILAFDRVTMSFQGRTYVLQSGPVAEYGSLAVLPAGMTEPASSDGSPVFQPVSGQTAAAVYVLTGKDTTSGIALPPGARADVAQGWSWWLPTAQ